MADGAMTGTGRQAAPDEVWAAVRDDYLSGLSGSECCLRHGVGLSALRARAARGGWRRTDQPWTAPQHLDPHDEGLALEESIGGDLDRIDIGDLYGVARARVHRAVLRGDAVAALRWRRVAQMMREDDEALQRWVEQEDHRLHRLLLDERDRLEREAKVAAMDTVNAMDSVHASDGVSDED